MLLASKPIQHYAVSELHYLSAFSEKKFEVRQKKLGVILGETKRIRGLVQIPKIAFLMVRILLLWRFLVATQLPRRNLRISPSSLTLLSVMASIRIHRREEYIGKQDPSTSKEDYLPPHVGTSISLLPFSCYKLCWPLSQSQVVEPQPQVGLGQQNQPLRLDRRKMMQQTFSSGHHRLHHSILHQKCISCVYTMNY